MHLLFDIISFEIDFHEVRDLYIVLSLMKCSFGCQNDEGTLSDSTM